MKRFSIDILCWTQLRALNSQSLIKTKIKCYVVYLNNYFSGKKLIFKFFEEYFLKLMLMSNKYINKYDKELNLALLVGKITF